MHEQFVNWFYSLKDWIYVFLYNVWPYAAVILFGVIFLILAFWVCMFAWGLLQVGCHSLWKKIKPLIELFKTDSDQKGGDQDA